MKSDVATIINKIILPPLDLSFEQAILACDLAQRFSSLLILAYSTQKDISSLSPAGTKTCLGLLKRSQSGPMALMTRLLLIYYSGSSPTLQKLRSFLRPSPSADGRFIDAWISEFEVSLRHSGRSLRPDLLKVAHQKLAKEVRVLCKEIIDEIGDWTILKDGREAILQTDVGEAPLWPLLVFENKCLKIWDGIKGEKGFFRQMALKINKPNGSVERELIIIEDSDWKKDGITGAMFAVMAETDPLSWFTDDIKKNSLKVTQDYSKHNVCVPVSGGTQHAVASELCQRLRGRQRPVLLLDLHTGYDSVEQLNLLLGTHIKYCGDSEPIVKILSSWRDEKRKNQDKVDTPILVLAMSTREYTHIEKLERQFGDLLQLVVVVNDRHLMHHWPVELRRRFPELDIELFAESVEAQKTLILSYCRLGLEESEAWLQAGIDCFGLKINNSESAENKKIVQKLVDIWKGQRDAFEIPIAYEWFTKGLIYFKPDGRIEAVSEDWNAFWSGFLGAPEPKKQIAPWQAGIMLRRHYDC